MSILMKTRGGMFVFVCMAATERSCDGWSIMRDRPLGPRAVETFDNRSTTPEVRGKLYSI